MSEEYVIGNFLGRCLEFYVARIHENQDVSVTQTVKFGKIFFSRDTLDCDSLCNLRN